MALENMPEAPAWVLSGSLCCAEKGGVGKREAETRHEADVRVIWRCSEVVCVVVLVLVVCV